MNTDTILYKMESQKIIGCAIEVHKELGHGFNEKPYENALVAEFQNEQIPFAQQQAFEILYKTIPVGKYIPDLIAFEKIIIDIKVIDTIGPAEIGQMMNYLKVTGLKLGYLINFKHPKLQWKRVIL